MTFRQYIAILILFFSLPIVCIAQESEEQLKQEAEALFEKENYKEAFNKYSQLLSLQLQSPEYNYRFGACQLFTRHDKEQALKYLKFAVDSKDAPNLSHFYYALGLHLNYRFEKAIKEYEKYQAGAGKKEKENQLVSHNIIQCNNGIKLISNFTDISVVQREALPRSDFYRNYDLTELGGKIMVKPEDFMSEEDNKRDAKFIMYFQQDADYIYYASYSEKNLTGKDLFVIQKLPTGDWSKPTKLSSTINTQYDEDFPFIHPDGNVLYFASKGHNSMGGYDIFKSTRRDDGSWTDPINMEFAINTPWDDFLFISDKDEKTAWFASNRETNSSQVVVYKIGIERVPLDLTLIKGTFIAEGSNEAKITIEDMVQNKVIGVYDSERQFGEYLLDLRGSGKYKFIVEAEESNAIHTGLVEVPREKGLKQFRQEMTLKIVDGKEQLQIINHFDEPLNDPTLLSAEILKKQASLNINSSEDDFRSTEILDEPLAIEAIDEGVSKEEKLGNAENSIKVLEGDAQLLNQKASLLFEKANAKSSSTNPTEIAEATIAAELASEYKKEAESRKSAASKMQGTFDVLCSNELEESAFNAQYNQLSATGNNFKTLDKFENEIDRSYSQRSKPSIDSYNAKQSEFDEINDDFSSINDEVAYLQTEIENTKDKTLQEEYNLQIKDAKSAIPAKEAERSRVKTELDVASKQKLNAEKYASITTALLEAAATGGNVATTASLASINQVQSALSAKALADPALVAFVAPEKAVEATALALSESRKNQTEDDIANKDNDSGTKSKVNNSENDLIEVEETSDSNDKASESNDGFDDFVGGEDAAIANETTDNFDSFGSGTSEEFNNTMSVEGGSSSDQSTIAGSNTDLSEIQEVASEADDFFADDSFETENAGNEGLETTDSENTNETSGIDNAVLNDEESQELNEEIRTISATESEPEILGGNYASKLQQQIAEASNAEDPVMAESRKAEIYDQWVENIDYRIDSLSKAQEGVSDTEQMLAFANQISDLEKEKESKGELAMESYSAVATLSDQQATIASTSQDPNSLASTEPSSDVVFEGFDESFDTESDDESFDSFIRSENRADASAEQDVPDEVPSENDPEMPVVREVNPDSIPPVTPEILNSKDVPPTVISLNSSYTQQLSGMRALPTKVEQKKEEARINKVWAADLTYELQVLSAQIKGLESPEQRSKLNELSANVASLRLEKVNKTAALQTEIIAAEKEELLSSAKKQLQQVLNQYVDSYNSNAFIQLEDQVANETKPELRKAKTEVLNQNWMVALKNEEFKTETRIANSVDSKQKAELEEKLVSISGEKLYVQATLDSLKSSEMDGPTPPKAVVVKGSEKFEGYIPVANGKPAEYDEKTQVSYNKIDRLNSKLTETEATLAATKKKKERAIIDLEIETIQNDLEVAQLETSYYEQAEPKIIGVEPLILQLESGAPTPSQNQIQVAEKLEAESNQITEAARITRESADAIKKKKKRLPAQADARKAEQLAMLKRKEAGLATQVANEMAIIEANAIATNFIIPAGQEVTLPVVNAKLNPTESSDVAATEQFSTYNTEKRKADSLRTISTKLLFAEKQLNAKAQNLMFATSLDPAVRLKTNAQAYVYYNRADSLSAVAARLNRQAAFIENDANQALIQNPEEVYNSILAYYNTDSTQNIIEDITTADLAELTGDLDDDANNSSNEVNSDTDIINASESDVDDSFDLTAPTEANKKVNVRSDVLTNTIFEADASAGSFYDSSTPIPVNPPMPSGLIYKVQIGAFRNAIKQDAFKGIKPITGESTNSGLTRYSAGEFTNFEEADFAKDEIRGIGYKDAFVVAYRNGKRVGSGASASSTNESNRASTASSGNSASTSRLPNNSVVKQGNLVINDVANQSGTFYTVQVGVFSRPVKSSDIYNITPLNQENMSNGTYRYTTGIYNSESTADQAKNEIRSLGITDAFVTAYNSGSRVTVDEARQQLGSRSSSNSIANTGSFRVLLGSFSGEVPLDQAAIILGLSTSGVEKVKNNDGTNSYYYGSFSSKQEAQNEASQLVSQGLTEAQARSK